MNSQPRLKAPPAAIRADGIGLGQRPVRPWDYMPDDIVPVGTCPKSTSTCRPTPNAASFNDPLHASPPTGLAISALRGRRRRTGAVAPEDR